jgi:hypothetical protein
LHECAPILRVHLNARANEIITARINGGIAEALRALLHVLHRRPGYEIIKEFMVARAALEHHHGEKRRH